MSYLLSRSDNFPRPCSEQRSPIDENRNGGREQHVDGCTLLHCRLRGLHRDTLDTGT